MSDWLISLEGTPAGHNLALGLALAAAVLHAVFGALQKGRHDPWLTRGATDIVYATIMLPVALFLVPWPEPFLWAILAGAWVIHMIYKLLQAQAYSKGDYTVVYPVVRGTGPLVTIMAAGYVFNEVYEPMQWLGVALLTAGIFGLAAYNLSRANTDRARLKLAITLAFFTGIMTAAYTTFDAYGIRAAADPFTFLAWFFVVDGIAFPIIATRLYRKMSDPPKLPPLMLRGFFGGIIALLSFGAIMMATRLDKVGEAAVLRETSTLFAALIGWLFLKETVGPKRAALMGLIAFGAVLVEFG
ncbi:MAG: drug/metabolite transporter (DMT)-like permease [Paracoccaceae bacterium]|jgi:drug/metabolite transporter (DMT)-like permease